MTIKNKSYLKIQTLLYDALRSSQDRKDISVYLLQPALKIVLLGKAKVSNISFE